MQKNNARWSRILRLFIFSFLAVLVLVDFGISWTYVRALVHPGCVPLEVPSESSLLPIVDTFTSHDGHELALHYYPSQNGAAVIITSALGGTGSLGYAQRDFLIEAGYGVLIVESRSCVGLPVTLGYLEGLDVPIVTAYLIEEGGIEAGRIGVMGFSMGGAAALIGAAETPEIGAVMHEGNYHQLGELFVPVEQSWVRKLIAYPIPLLYWMQTGVNLWDVSPIDAVAALSPRAVLSIYGSEEILNSHGREQFEAAGEPKELWVVPGGTHGGNYWLFPEEYGERVVAFFDAYLK